MSFVCDRILCTSLNANQLRCECSLRLRTLQVIGIRQHMCAGDQSDQYYLSLSVNMVYGYLIVGIRGAFSRVVIKDGHHPPRCRVSHGNGRVSRIICQSNNSDVTRYKFIVVMPYCFILLRYTDMINRNLQLTDSLQDGKQIIKWIHAVRRIFMKVMATVINSHRRKIQHFSVPAPVGNFS